jgi:hypothetical protein
MVSLRHQDDGRPIEVVDTFFTEDLLVSCPQNSITTLPSAPD